MKLYHKIKTYFRERSYVLGFIEKDPFSSDFDFRQVKWMNTGNYKNGWFADPFIFKITDTEIHILAEEYEYSNRKGRLVYLTIQRDGYKLKQVDVMLELDTHLSFPIFFEEGGRIYVYPENYQGKSLKLYEFDESERKLVNPHVLIDGELLDTQIIKIDGMYYAMGVLFSENGHDSTRVLKIYSSHSLAGPFREIQEIKNEFREERGAGRFISINGLLIRPAQCCEGGYGRNVIFYEMSIKDGFFLEKEIIRLQPEKNMRNGLGLHTYNHMNGIAVIDGLEYRHRIIGRITNYLYEKWSLNIHQH